MSRKFILTLIFITGIITVLYFVLMRLSYFALPETEARSVDVNKLYAAKLDFSQVTPAPENSPTTVSAKLKQTAWIPDWDFTKGFSNLQASADYFDSVSPVWYYLNKDGTVQTKKVGLDKLTEFTRSHNLKLIPTISSFDADEFGKILTDETKLQAHIAYLLAEVDQNGYDGLDLDYESVSLNDQPAYLYLIKSLSKALHAKGKLLTIAVISKWSDRDIYRSLRQTRKVQDWHEIAPLVDELRIMTYDLTGYTATYPGPVAPLDWAEANLRYASTHVDSAKVMLGMNQYGYDGWSNNLHAPVPYLGLYANPLQDKGQADAVTYTQVQKRGAHKVSDVLDPNSLEKIMHYTEPDPADKKKMKEYIIYYPDAESASYRFQLAKQYGIAGLAYWRMGGEDLNTYSLDN